MATSKETPFQAWDFTTEEYPVAVVFTDLQEKHLRTELAIAATEKLTLAVTPENMQKYYLEQEFIRGKMEMISYLLITSDAAKTDLQKAIAESVSKQAVDSKPVIPTKP